MCAALTSVCVCVLCPALKCAVCMEEWRGFFQAQETDI